MHEQILELKKKQESQVELLKQKHKSDEAAKRLQAEIQSIKAQKVRFFFPYFLGAYAKFRSDMQDILLYIYWQSLDLLGRSTFHVVGSVAE